MLTYAHVYAVLWDRKASSKSATATGEGAAPLRDAGGGGGGGGHAAGGGGVWRFTVGLVGKVYMCVCVCVCVFMYIHISMRIPA
jgi:hypothetical protein